MDFPFSPMPNRSEFQRALLRGINPMSMAPEDPREEQNRRARAGITQAQEQLAQLQGPQDYSGMQQYAKDRAQQGKGHLLMALAAQEAGERFAPIGATYLKQAMAAREPIKTATGYITETGEHVEDPQAQAQQKIKVAQAQLQKYEQILSANVTAEERERARAEQQQWQRIYQQSMMELRQQQMAMTNAIAQGNQAMRQAQLDAQKQLTEEKVAAAKDKRERAETARTSKLQMAEAQGERIQQTIDETMGMISNMSAGFPGSWLSGMPSSSAKNLEAKLQTVKANLGFDRLQQMREESPTGGALGQVAVQELVALQAVIASLDQKQSPKQLAQSLQRVGQHYQNWLNVMRQTNASGNDAPAGAVRSRAGGGSSFGDQRGGGGTEFEAAPDAPPPGAVRPKGAQ